ncbi:spermidine hydroxycinnamoyl transferase-like [Vigna unguiculata]|uniref:Shikimate O-hydroxycinnamoyltransferase n=1 Tax=Vigna unguiculata TaxID=3917 RepID=A0A4D6KS47_VIGUN|nr:spermidine hydroxycinnamoyl transferase-like [Vigna unguiculata]QCD80352.1 shikimate O-hydroxycinnamoyltransferase [Vigna unguiculata]
MSVTVKESCTVRPMEPTWCGRVALSEFDQTGKVTHVPLIYFYRLPQNAIFQYNTIASTLKDSLSRVLVPFYPLAGRLHWTNNGRLELDCNATGIRFIEAESSSTLQHLTDFSSSNEHHYLVPAVDYYSLPIHELPLVVVQLTKFKCGGICIGITLSHAVVDGPSALHFVSEWARLSRGEPLHTVPFLDRKILRAGEPPLVPLTKCHLHKEFNDPPFLLGRTDNREEREKETAMAFVKISKTEIETLKKRANESSPRPRNDRGYSRYESVTGHIWRCASKAREHKENQPTVLTIIVDSRGRLKPPLPNGYFGNANLDSVACSLAGDLVSEPLGYTASRIREAIERVSDEYVRSGIEFLKNQKNLRRFHQDLHEEGREKEPFFGNPNLSVVSWLRLPIYGIDFGWGKEVRMSPATHDFDGDFVLLPDPNEDGSVLVCIGLQVVHIDAFKKHFYQDLA